MRKKLLISVYAVATYIDKSILDRSKDTHHHSLFKNEISIKEALLNPIKLARTIRIVIYWNVPMYLVTKGITDAMRPRLSHKMPSEELVELEKQLHSLMENHHSSGTSSTNDSGQDVDVGTEILLRVEGDTMYVQNKYACDDDNHHDGGDEELKEGAKIRNKLFCFAICDVYYGDRPVSEHHKANVIAGIQDYMM